MNLISVYEQPDRHQHLYDLLKERDETTNISHRALPEWEDHVRFVDSRPYPVWNFIEVNRQIVGACYLTAQNEIGIFIFREHQGNGYGPQAIQMLMKLNGPRPYLANINPRNERSAALFARLGFTCKQHTYGAA